MSDQAPVFDPDEPVLKRLIEQIRVASFEAPKAHSHTEWELRLAAFLGPALVESSEDADRRLDGEGHLRYRISELQVAIAEFLIDLDKLMVGPSTYERGRQIARLANRLQEVAGEKQGYEMATVEDVKSVVRAVMGAADLAAIEARTQDEPMSGCVQHGVTAAFECALGNGLIRISAFGQWPKDIVLDPPYEMP